MYLLRTLVFDKDRSVAEKLQSVSPFGPLQIAEASDIQELEESLAADPPDIIVLHESPGEEIVATLDNLRKLRPSIPAILLCGAASSAWTVTINDKATEVLCETVSAQDIHYRIAKLKQGCVAETLTPYLTRSKVQIHPELRNVQSGRLDAKKISVVFGMTLADVCRSINKPLQAVHKTPDSKNLQEDLFFYERIASSISNISKQKNALRIWLNAPNKAYPGKLPVDMIIAGKGGKLASLLEDVLLGHPE